MLPTDVAKRIVRHIHMDEHTVLPLPACEKNIDASIYDDHKRYDINRFIVAKFIDQNSTGSRSRKVVQTCEGFTDSNLMKMLYDSIQLNTSELYVIPGLSTMTVQTPERTFEYRIKGIVKHEESGYITMTFHENEYNMKIRLWAITVDYMTNYNWRVQETNIPEIADVLQNSDVEFLLYMLWAREGMVNEAGEANTPSVETVTDIPVNFDIITDSDTNAAFLYHDGNLYTGLFENEQYLFHIFSPMNNVTFPYTITRRARKITIPGYASIDTVQRLHPPDVPNTELWDKGYGNSYIIFNSPAGQISITYKSSSTDIRTTLTNNNFIYLFSPNYGKYYGMLQRIINGSSDTIYYIFFIMNASSGEIKSMIRGTMKYDSTSNSLTFDSNVPGSIHFDMSACKCFMYNDSDYASKTLSVSFVQRCRNELNNYIINNISSSQTFQFPETLPNDQYYIPEYSNEKKLDGYSFYDNATTYNGTTIFLKDKFIPIGTLLRFNREGIRGYCYAAEMNVNTSIFPNCQTKQCDVYHFLSDNRQNLRVIYIYESDQFVIVDEHQTVMYSIMFTTEDLLYFPVQGISSLKLSEMTNADRTHLLEITINRLLQSMAAKV